MAYILLIISILIICIVLTYYDCWDASSYPIVSILYCLKLYTQDMIEAIVFHLHFEISKLIGCWHVEPDVKPF